MSDIAPSARKSARISAAPTFDTNLHAGNIWETGYKKFGAPEGGSNDGSQSCGATLEARKTGSRKKGTEYIGSSAVGNGHAEIHALSQFLKDKDIELDFTAFDTYSLTITCSSKPCCRGCSAVMGLLDVSAGIGTYKTDKSMGVSYALPPTIVTFLAGKLKVTEATITQGICG